MNTIVSTAITPIRQSRKDRSKPWSRSLRAVLSLGLLFINGGCGDVEPVDGDGRLVSGPSGEAEWGEVEKSAAQMDGSAYDMWFNNEQLDLEYCVNSNPNASVDPFPAAGPYSHASAVAAMAAATADWQRVANVRFEYHPERNGSQCDYNDATPSGGSPSSFKVIYIDLSTEPYNACAFRPQTGGECRGMRTLLFNGGGDHPLGMTRTFRHELGHILGLAHEFERLDNPAPEEEGCDRSEGASPLTEYDVNSIMQAGEGFCGGEPLENITRSDGQGLRALYGAPASWFAAYTLTLLQG